MVRIPLSESTFMDNEKGNDFWLGWGGRRELQIQEVIVGQNSARVCVRLARRSPRFSSCYIFCLNVLNALSVCLCDAIIKLTHSTTRRCRSSFQRCARARVTGLRAHHPCIHNCCYRNKIKLMRNAG